VNDSFQTLIRQAINEDIPSGDVTTDNLDLENKPARARLVAKEDIVISGIEVFNAVFRHFENEVILNWSFKNGDIALAKQTLCSLKGSAAALLKAERVALNFFGRLCGIATLTRCYVEPTSGSKTRILDTRKTTPGLRALEKLAVIHGGGENHRANLSAAVLIKENHIRACGGVKQTYDKIKKRYSGFIEIEVRNLEEATIAANCKVDRILLDNMTNEEIEKALKIIPAGIGVEVSGNISIERVKPLVDLGVHYISVGAITHSAPCADVSLLFDEI